MQTPRRPSDEAERLQALHDLAILDTEPEPRFDRLTRMAQQMFGVQMALISLVDSERQWFKSRQGLEVCETGRDISFCGHAVLQDEIFHIPDATLDPRFSDNPLVVGPLHLRFYAGAPLSTADGYRIGTLCIISDTARQLTAQELRLLRDLADCVEEELERSGRRQSSAHQLELARLAQVVNQISNGVVITNRDGLVEWVNEGYTRLCGYTLAELKGHRPSDLLRGEQTDPLMMQQIHEAQRRGEPCVVELIKYNSAGDPYWVNISYSPLRSVAGELQGFMAIETDISERKENEAKLSSTTRLLESILENVPNVIFLKRAEDLRYEYFNRAAEELLGYSRADLLGHNDYDFFPKEQADFFVSKDRAVLAQKGVVDIPAESIDTPGGRRTLHTQKLALCDEHGEPLYLLGISEDITERKQAEHELNQFKRTLDQTLDCVFMFDADTLLFFYANEGALRQVGYSREELLTMRPDEIKPEITTEQFHALIAPLLSGQQPSLTFETVHQHKSGQRVPVEIFLQYLPPDDEPARFVAIVRDISERRGVEAAVREQAQHTQAILDNMVDGIITIDRRGMVDSFNPAAMHIFGYAPEEVQGRNVKMLMPNPYHDAHDGYLHNYQTTGVARIIGIGREVTGLRKDGSEFPMELAVSAITRDGREMYVGIVRDITERKRVERMKSEFVSTVSHELRTPLTSISGALGLISGGALGPLPPQILQMITIAHKNSQRLTFLINDLLDMEKLVAGKMHFDMEVQPLLPLIEQVLEANRAYGAERQVTQQLVNELGGAEVLVDSQRLIQVLSNLLSNAIKYSPVSGVVEIAATAEHDSVRVTVTDHGGGVPVQFRERIFQKFAQADSSDTRQKGGTGLGLAISKELVERMGGHIGFDSVEGQGASFYFELPRRQAQPVAEGRSTVSRILVVEDEEAVAELLALVYIKAGYAVDIVNTGVDALAALRRREYALMSLDLMLPDINGLEVITQVRQRPETRELPIVVVSAAVNGEELMLRGDFSNIDWQAKPIDDTRLLKVLERQLAAASAHHPRVLHVEDDLDLHQVICAMVGGRFEIELATTLAEARVRLALEHFDVVILDIGLPDGSGWDLLADIRATQPEARVVVLSGTQMSADERRQVEAVLLKSQISPDDLIAAIEKRIQRSS